MIYKTTLLIAAVLLAGCASAPADPHKIFGALAVGAAAGALVQHPQPVYYAVPQQRTRCYRVFREIRCDSY